VQKPEKKKVCLVTWYWSPNYGTTLQCLALSKAVDRLGYEAYLPDRLGWFSLRDPADLVRRVKQKIRKRIETLKGKSRFSSLDAEVQQGYRLRQKRMYRLTDEEIRIYPIKGRSTFSVLCQDMHAFVTGSDQIWNPNYIAAPFLLSFARDEDLKIAYGSSIGVAEIPARLRPMYRRYLSRFSAIGVREKSAQRLVEGLVDVPVRTVLDPSFLLNGAQWHEISDRAEIPEAYRRLPGFIFCYFIGDKTGWQRDAEILSEEYGLPVICCLSESGIVPEVGQAFADAGAREFLWMVEHAAMVLTDSFHAVALSVNFRREFAVYKRFDDGDKASQNSRITDVLEVFGLQDRLVTDERTAEGIFQNAIQYDHVDGILAGKREDSLAFLKNALERKY